MPRGKPFGPGNPGKPFGPGHARNLPVRFPPGNEASVKHGGYMSADRLAKEPETLALADAIRQSLPLYGVCDETSVALLAITLRRVERAAKAVEAADALSQRNPLAPYLVANAEALGRLREDLRKWSAWRRTWRPRSA